jgi:hypothetical protein
MPGKRDVEGVTEAEAQSQASSHTDRTTRPYSRRGSREGRGRKVVVRKLSGRRVTGSGLARGAVPREELHQGVGLRQGEGKVEELQGSSLSGEPPREGLLGKLLRALQEERLVHP